MNQARRRWDPLVRTTHWAIALAILANAVFTEEGSTTHVWVGYGLASILLLRLFWGLIGPAEARFTAFPPSPSRAIAHLRDIRAGRKESHRSHNPLGALMVYAIWACLLVIIGSGIAMAGLPGADGRPVRNAPAITRDGTPGAPPAEAEEEEEGEDEGEGGHEQEGPMEEVHEVAVNLLYLLILLHIAGVAFETRRSGRDVVLAMMPGRR
jgi:cytochrome b